MSTHGTVLWDWQRLWWSLTAVAMMVAGLGPRPAAALPCVGDCDGNGAMGVSELITGVNIALGTEPLSACPAFDNGTGKVSVDALISAVNNALNGCPPTPTVTGKDAAATATGTHPPTASATVTDAGAPTSTPTETPRTADPPSTARYLPPVPRHPRRQERRRRECRITSRIRRLCDRL